MLNLLRDVLVLGRRLPLAHEVLDEVNTLLQTVQAHQSAHVLLASVNYQVDTSRLLLFRLAIEVAVL